MNRNIVTKLRRDHEINLTWTTNKPRCISLNKLRHDKIITDSKCSISVVL